MDLRMPGLDGVEAMKAIRAEFRDARFLVLTMYRRDEDIYRAFCAGALGYVLKSSSSDVNALVDAMQKGADQDVGPGGNHCASALVRSIRTFAAVVNASN
jgi:DNA-binding NarL/FixJ family response regulator